VSVILGSRDVKAWRMFTVAELRQCKAEANLLYFFPRHCWRGTAC